MFNLENIFLLILFFLLSYPLIDKYVQKSKPLKLLLISTILIVGLFLRLYLAYFSSANFDLESFDLVSNLVLEAKNVYSHTYRYNYSPIWFITLGIFKRLAILSSIPFDYVVRSFLTLVDAATLLVLYGITKIKKISFEKTAVYFFLNPVSIILSGHHGQFENLTILFILIGIYFYLKNKNARKAWVFFTLAGIIKHLVFNQLIIFLQFSLKKIKKVVLFTLLSIICFLIIFLPYLPEAQEPIIKHVFAYSSGRIGDYGITNIFQRFRMSEKLMVWYKFIFYPLYFIFPLFLSSKQLIRNLLLGMLFFLGFTFGFVVQSSILPIALGSLIGGPGFFVFSLIFSFYVMGHGAELDIDRYKTINLTEIWLAVLFWFFIEFYKKKFDKK